MDTAGQLDVVASLLLAVGLGSAVGFEREWRGHEAGIRTLAMVCVGSAIFGEVSIISGESRIAAGVVQGVGFLGAGIIFQRDDAPRGLTTAATAWAIAGVGLAVAYDLYLVAILTTIAFLVLLELQQLSDWVLGHSREVQAARALRDDKGSQVDSNDDPSLG